MYAINDVVTLGLQPEHRVSQEVSGGTLYSTLENGGSYEGITTPLPCICVLGMDDNAHFLTSPRGGEQLELWPLPADQST